MRYSAALSDGAAWQAIVHDGVRQANGMIAFSELLSVSEIESIRTYVIHRANQQVAQDRARVQ